jgi:beta-phosphoglucomutase-like phosphatase (HAD superfamily)
MPRAALFDVDGTLVDTNDVHAQAWAETFRHFGRQTTAVEVRPHIGKGGDQLMPVFLDAVTIDRDGEEIEQFRADLFKDRYLQQARAFPRVRELFEAVRSRGIRILLARAKN